MLNKKDIPFEIGNCDTCLEEGVMVLECTVNNKCNYTMCTTCMTELKYITKTNLCPNCREVKEELISDDEITIDLDDYEEVENEEQDSEEEEEEYIVWCRRCRKCCWKRCECIFIPIIFYYVCCCEDIIGGFFKCYYEILYSCLDVDSLRYRPRLKRMLVLSLMVFLFILILFLGGVAYSAFFGQHPIQYMMTHFGLFIFHSLVGCLLIFAFIFGIVLISMCCCDAGNMFY